ncbi:filamentous hemagglutinin N-terminal domain-containing protein [Pelagibius sp. Alg239-R121]|uniref:two-partner secretion domain-containing protein n=1 Tax=Pelagibius sp. Alg239-R121 TaxID=2993448 RepID=UPI0024A6646A|nr:filamentous hemagglutinin N-terminal domain-containing protein [Pelagibius sp. Alg239-R121]
MNKNWQGTASARRQGYWFCRGDRSRHQLLSSTALVTHRMGLALALVGVLLPSALYANPKGGQVVGGSATIVETSPSRLDVHQSSDKAIINWQSFSIDQAERTNFVQPSKASVALNRVVGGDLSRIAGQLTANGNLILINPNGVVFTDTARVDVNGLIASTSDIDNNDFMNGRLNFSAASDSSSFVINRGQITAAEGGLVALVAPWVENSGLIGARLGRVELASGGAFTVDLYGDQLIQLAVADTQGASGQMPDELSGAAKVANLGAINADGGVVALTVADAQTLVANVINMEGIIEARSVEQTAGRIVLNGGDSGIVNLSGALDASGKETGEHGGRVAVLGEKVGLFDDALIDVSGDIGGGEVLIGGNYQGAGAEPNAQFSYVGKDARVEADALSEGDGGRVIVWADQVTRFEGNVTARGGATGGNGGFSEVSGKQHLAFQGSVDLTAPQGARGTLLLDPNNITIDATEGDVDITGDGSTGDPFTSTDDDSILSLFTLDNALNIADVVVQTGSAGSNSQDGDIIVLAEIVGGPGAQNLTLIAHDDIIFAESGGIDYSGAEGSISLQADGVSSDGVGAIINNGEFSTIISIGSDGILELIAGSGIGDSESPITIDGEASVAALTTDSGGIFIEGNDDIFVSIGSSVEGLDSAEAISLVSTGGSVFVSHPVIANGDITVGSDVANVTVSSPITSESGSIFIDADNDIALSDNLTADAEVVLESAAGDVFITGSTVDIVADEGFTLDGDAIISADLSIQTAGGDIVFTGFVDGSGGEPEEINPDLTLSSGNGVVNFGDFVGDSVGLGEVDATGSSTLIASGSEGEEILLVEGFERVDDEPLPSTFNVSALLPEFDDTTTTTETEPTTTPTVDPVNQTLPSTQAPRRDEPARVADASPVANATNPLLTLQDLSDIAPGAGAETVGQESILISETDSEAISEILDVIVESCPDVILTSLSWQNTPADAAFNRDPTVSPYSVDEYCGGYVMTYPGRGSGAAYQGLSFVTRDFWTDLDQSREPEVIPALLQSFGLQEQDGK